MEALLNLGYKLIDNGRIPDFVLRPVIRALCRQRIREITHGSFEAQHAAKMDWIQQVKSRETIAELTDKANEQHYEVSTDFILSCLGPLAKYSACLYPTGKETLEEAEVLMLEKYCQRAELQDGQDVLDLGCGWGSLSLYLAQKYPNSRITGLSNSATQKAYIDATAKVRGLSNLEIITADVNVHQFPKNKRFNRILSIEMFEHMKNYQILFRKVSTWLRSKGADEEDSLLFIHVFCHRTTPYHFETGDGWMAQNFFSGGTMPSHDLFLYFQDDLSLIRSWWINGRNYAQTSEQWLQEQDKNGQAVLAELERDSEAKGMGREEGRKTFYRFRVFYLAVAEFFGLNDGEEWGVGHYLFRAK